MDIEGQTEQVLPQGLLDNFKKMESYLNGRVKKEEELEIDKATD